MGQVEKSSGRLVWEVRDAIYKGFAAVPSDHPLRLPYPNPGSEMPSLKRRRQLKAFGRVFLGVAATVAVIEGVLRVKKS